MTLSIQYSPYNSNTKYQSNLCVYGMFISVNLSVEGETSIPTKCLTTVVYFIFLVQNHIAQVTLNNNNPINQSFSQKKKKKKKDSSINGTCFFKTNSR